MEIGKRSIACIILLLVSFSGYAQEPAKPLTYVEQMAAFPGGDDSLQHFLLKNIHYPAEALKNKIEGTVLLQFVVSAEGNISDIKTLRNVEGGCTEEAIRIVGIMPKWLPGRQNGKTVPVFVTLPIIFQLPDNVRNKPLVPDAGDNNKGQSTERITVFDRTNNGGLAPFTGYVDTARNKKSLNSLKINPLLFINGDLPIYYERQVGRKESIEGALGATFENYAYVLEMEGSSKAVVSSDTKWGVGYSIKIAYKYYPGVKNIMDGLYVSPQLSYINHPLQYPDYSSPYSSAINSYSNYFEGHYNVADLRLLVGTIFDFWDSDNIIGDLYCGVGIRNVSIKYYTENNSGLGIGSTPQTTSDIKPGVYLGLKIGFNWR